MTNLYLGVAAVLMMSIFLGGLRIARGPTRADRMLAAQFLTTTSIAILLLLAEAFQHSALRNLSLVFVALATLTTIAFVQAYSRGRKSKS